MMTHTVTIVVVLLVAISLGDYIYIYICVHIYGNHGEPRNHAVWFVNEVSCSINKDPGTIFHLLLLIGQTQFPCQSEMCLEICVAYWVYLTSATTNPCCR